MTQRQHPATQHPARGKNNDQADIWFMRLALEQARIGQLAGNAPIGCVIVSHGTLVALGHNRVVSDCDPTAHAEIVTIRAASRALAHPDLTDMTLYSTLQPCGMCSMASLWANITRIVYGAGRADVHPMYFEERHFDTLDYLHDAYSAHITLTGSILLKDCASLYCPSA